MSDSTPKKRCSKCGFAKSINDFHRMTASKDGLAAWCRRCSNENRRKNWKLNPPGKHPVSVNEKLCCDCNAVKEACEFTREAESSDGLHCRCRVCLRKRRIVRGKAVGVSEKLCSSCDLVKPAAEFPVKSDMADRLNSYCTFCTRVRKHGLTLPQYAELFERQGGACICGVPIELTGTLHIDHDHSCCVGVRSCGACVRGLLCGSCNRALGLLEDSPERLIKLAVYLGVSQAEMLFGFMT
jgi:Recombination endonuclease VII